MNPTTPISKSLQQVYEEYADLMEQDTEFDAEYLNYIFAMETVDQE